MYFFRYQSEKLDINVGGNRTAIIFFKYFWCIRGFKDLKI